MRFNSPLVCPRWQNSVEDVGKNNPGHLLEMRRVFFEVLFEVVRCSEKVKGVLGALVEQKRGEGEVSDVLKFDFLANIDSRIELPGEVLRVATYFSRPHLVRAFLPEYFDGHGLDDRAKGEFDDVSMEVLSVINNGRSFDFFEIDADCDGLIVAAKGGVGTILNFLSMNPILMRNLKVLDLSGNHFKSGEFVKLIAQLKKFTSLRELSFENVIFSKTMAASLWKSGMGNLVTLNLRETGLDDNCLEVFSRKNSFDALRNLILGGNDFSHFQLRRFFELNEGKFWSDVFLTAERPPIVANRDSGEVSGGCDFEEAALMNAV